MGLNFIKSLLLIFCLFNLVLNQEPHTLKPQEKTTINGNGEKTFSIGFTEGSFKEYFKLIFSLTTSEDKRNPSVIISTDKDSKKRIYTSVQLYDKIYIFLKHEQIKSQFYICVQNRENSAVEGYTIDIIDEDKAYLPFNQQTSYYISDDESNKEMEFVFQKDNSGSKDISFWAQGKSISSATTTTKGFQSQQYSSSYTINVFYGSTPTNDFDFKVKSSKGDYITVGSVTLSDQSEANELKENRNEILVASTKDEVCFPISYSNKIMYITGKIFTFKAKGIFKDSEKKPIVVDDVHLETNFTNGILNELNIVGFITKKNEKGTYCLESTGLKIFSIQMTCNLGETELVTGPLLPGDIRTHFLERGQFAIFYGTKPSDKAKEVNFNLKSLTGFPEMYYNECTTFPNCHYTFDQIKNWEHPHPSNRITVYSFYMEDMKNKNFNPITENQPLMIVYCGEGGKQSLFGESSFCIFETTIFTSDDNIILLPESTFSQYLLAGEKDNYQVNFPEVAQDGVIMYLDLMLFSGDVDLVYEGQEDVKANKYYLSNKIFYSIHLKRGMKEIKFYVLGNTNAFYMVQYQIINSNKESDDENTIESGVNYITTKNVDDKNNLKKNLNLINYKIEFKQPYLVTLYSPNCKFGAFWNSDPKLEPSKISYLDNYAYRIISPDDPYYNQDKYKFYYEIQQKDLSEFPKKFCVVNVAGLELSDSNTEWNGRSISLSEGVPHTYTFTNNYPLIYYSYHASNTSNTLILNFNLIDKAYFNITIRVNRKNPTTSTIYRNTQLYVTQYDFEKNCPKDEVCTVDVEILMWNSTRERKVETTMYQLDGLPFYLEKNVLRDDIINGNNPKHYYFDIGSEEYGDITLDFKRGSGFIYASIEPRIKSETPKNPDWRGHYKFPVSTFDTLKYRTYGKKIMIESSDTEICSNIGGCYVLITILNNMEIKDNAETPYRISIIPRIMKNEQSAKSPKVKINVNEFIVGDILTGQMANRYYDYYTVTLPYDSDYILIDWQADSPTLVVNVGTDRPTIEDKHFDFPAIDHDTVFRINRSAIIDKINYDDDDTHDSLRDVELTIGIYSERSDSLQSSPYAFKLFMPPILATTDEGEVISAEIIHIRSDQKVQCLPFEYDLGIYTCLFAVIFDDSDIMNNLIAYPRSQDGRPIEIYGDLIKAEYIETNDRENIMLALMEYFREEHKINQKYIYIENIHKDESYFLIVKTDDPSTVIEVLSSTYNIIDGMVFYPNPSTPQILALKNNSIEIEIFTSQELLINLGSVDGTGAFCWSDECDNKTKISYLNDLGDRLSLTNYKNELGKLYTPLKVQPLVNLDDKPGGFIFYITYYPRSYIDQVKRGSTTEIQYRTVRMPLDYYVPVKLIYSNTINFNIYSMDTKNGEDLVYDSELFNVWGTLISNTEAVQIRLDPKYRPQMNDTSINIKKGVFDIIFATLYFSEEDMDKFQPKEGEGNIPNIFFSLEPIDKEKCNFSSFGLELDISSVEKELGSEPAPEGVYLTGNLANTMFGRKVYRLKLNPNKIFLRIEYSSNSYFIDYALSSNIFSEKNDEFKKINTTEEYGKKVIIVEFDEEYFSKNSDSLFFTIFTKYNNEDPKLQYYVLKYINAQSLDDITSFFIPLSNTLDVTKENNNIYKLRFEPFLDKTDVTYYIKAVYKSGVNFEENINSIAISETKGKNVQIAKPNIKNGMIEYYLEVDKDISYIKVLARFNFLYGKYIYLYTPYETEITEITYSNGLEKSFSAAKKARYELIFDSQELENIKYIKVTVQSSTGEQTPVLYFSPTDSKCIENRVQLAKGGEMWIKKEQFQKKHFYFVVECPQNGCNYVLTFSDSDMVVFESMGIFNYFVYLNNAEMVFKFKNEFYSEDGQITLYATGGKNIKLALKDCQGEGCSQFNFAEGAAITTAANSKEYFILTVTAEFGDCISVGAKNIDSKGKSSVNTLTSGTGQISGFIKKNLLEKECYQLPSNNDIYYITGTSYNSFGMFALVGSDLVIDPIKGHIFRGYISFIYNKTVEENYDYLCIKRTDVSFYDSDSFSYSIQLQSKTNFDGNNYPPLYPGGIYSRIIPTGKLAMFNYIFPHVPSEYTVYNMITTEGYPKMYVFECFTYPFCELDYNTLEDNKDVKRISDINRMSTYFIETKKTAFPIDAHQYLLVVKCNEANGSANDDYNHCEFMTSIFGEKEEVVLIKEQPFGQYMIQNDTDQFLIDLDKDKQNFMKIHIDFYVVSGDVSFEIKDKDTDKVLEDIHKYYLANKIFYSITIDKEKNRNVNLDKIKIQVTAKVNSYYIVEYKLIYKYYEEYSNTIFSGINYLIPISQNSTGELVKSLVIKSVKIVRPKAYIDTFYSLNCKINVHKFTASGGQEQLSSFGDFAQEFHPLVEEEDEMNEERSYNITISQDGKYVLNDKDMCMVYVSGFEIYDTNSGVRKEILLSEGVPHLVHFVDDLTVMRYVYPHADPKKDLTVSLNMIIPGKFIVHYFFREKEYNTVLEVSQSTILFVPRNVIQTGCQEEDELCSITVQINNTELFDGVEPQIELTIKQIKNTPYYVPRGIIRKDYISGEAFLFLYTDVGQDEGYIRIYHSQF